MTKEACLEINIVLEGGHIGTNLGGLEQQIKHLEFIFRQFRATGEF